MYSSSLAWKARKACREQAGAGLIDHLRHFLLELGRGFSFVARQQRITLGGDHFYIDLVFYNRLTKSFVLIDLKVGKLSHQDIGQMQMYVNYYKRTQMVEGENPPIGIILCAEKNDAVVRFTLPENGDRSSSPGTYLTFPQRKNCGPRSCAKRNSSRWK